MHFTQYIDESHETSFIVFVLRENVFPALHTVSHSARQITMYSYQQHRLIPTDQVGLRPSMPARRNNHQIQYHACHICG